MTLFPQSIKKEGEAPAELQLDRRSRGTGLGFGY